MLPSMLNVATREKFAHANEMRAMENKWSQLYTPTYVLVGENDAVADTANYTFARRHLTNCPAVFVKLRQTGHQVTYQHPALVRSLLLDNNSGCNMGNCLDNTNPLFAQIVDNSQQTRMLSARSTTISAESGQMR
jgi:hypothetical protein